MRASRRGEGPRRGHSIEEQSIPLSCRRKPIALSQSVSMRPICSTHREKYWPRQAKPEQHIFVVEPRSRKAVYCCAIRHLVAGNGEQAPCGENHTLADFIIIVSGERFVSSGRSPAPKQLFERRNIGRTVSRGSLNAKS
jgi:hypothetical protein